jgi:hypothetical protein
VRERAARAIVVVYEDVAVVQGCVVTARWECVVPAAPLLPPPPRGAA